MGSSQSSEVKQTVEILNKSMTNMVTKNTNSASARNINANNLSITTGEKSRYAPGVDPNKCGGLTVSQKIKAGQTVKVMAKITKLSELKTQMKTALQNSIDQASTSKQAALATSLNVQNSKQSISQKVSNIVETNITDEVVNEVNGFLDNVNNGTFVFQGIIPCGAFSINQEIVSDQVVSLLSDAMIGTSISNSTDTAAAAVSKQKTASEQTGVIGELAGLVGTMGMIWVAVIGIIVLGVVFFLPTILKALGGGGSKMGMVLFGKKRFRFGRRRFR